MSKHIRQTYVTHNEVRVGLLSYTDAMAAPSHSLPAGYSCPGAPRCEGSPCAGCYAKQGMYSLPSTVSAQWARYHYLVDSLKSNPQEWVATMVGAILRATIGGFFRWHDSGDILSPAHAKAIGQVIAATPGILHWIPTQSHRVAAIRKAIEKHILPLDNVVVRPSAEVVDGEPTPAGEGWAAGSVVYSAEKCDSPDRGVMVCPKTLSPEKGASCESVGCRCCWKAPFLPIAYRVHGVGGKHVLSIISDKVKAKREEQRKEYSPK